MAVYTHVDDRTLRGLLAGYDIGAPLSFKGIAEGVENSNFLLETDAGRYILTLYEKRANPDDLPYFLDMMEHLARSGVPAPSPIRNARGESLQTVAGRPACIISFLSGVSVDLPDVAQCSALGATLAKLHLALADYPHSRTNDLSLSGWQTLFNRTAKQADTVKEGLRLSLERELDFLAQHWPDAGALPTGPIHADLFPDNVLFTGSTITGLIDFYFACTDMLAYDLAVCINAWCFDADHRFIADKAHAMVSSYAAVRALNNDEKRALPLLCRGAAIRFLLTRLFDWLNPVEGAVVRPKNPLDYHARLMFHQTAKDGAVYGA